MNILRIITKLIFAPLALSMSYYDASFALSSPQPRVWGSAEYLNWWVQDSPISAPLITQNNNPSAFGFINEPGTTIIFGADSNRNSFNFGSISGVSVTIGGWLDDACRYGIEASGFGFPEEKQSFNASSVNGKIPIVNIPFFSTQMSSDVGLLNGLPKTASVTVSDTFQPTSIELNGLVNVENQSQFPLVLLAGFHYMNINEKLSMNDAVYNATLIPNSVLNINDVFATTNNFYGFQVGARTGFDRNKLNFSVATAIALGVDYQKLGISGQSNLNNTQILQPIGLFAEPSNIGTFKNNQFAVLPQLEAKISYHLNRNISPFITYTFIYLSNTIRPGNQIDPNINNSQNKLIGGTGVLTGPASPAVKFNNSGMWMQGVSVGVEFA
jgi:hypothetical protein